MCALAPGLHYTEAAQAVLGAPLGGSLPVGSSSLGCSRGGSSARPVRGHGVTPWQHPPASASLLPSQCLSPIKNIYTSFISLFKMNRSLFQKSQVLSDSFGCILSNIFLSKKLGMFILAHSKQLSHLHPFTVKHHFSMHQNYLTGQVDFAHIYSVKSCYPKSCFV